MCLLVEICKEQTLRALRCVGFSEEVATRATNDNFDAVGGGVGGCINVFSMQFDKELEHDLSTGVLEGINRLRMDKYLSFCDGGVCTEDSIRKAIAFFCQEAHTFNANKWVTPGECEGSNLALFTELCPTVTCSSSEWNDLFLQGRFPLQFQEQSAFQECMRRTQSKSEATAIIEKGKSKGLGQSEGCPFSAVNGALVAVYTMGVVFLLGAMCLFRSCRKTGGQQSALAAPAAAGPPAGPPARPAAPPAAPASGQNPPPGAVGVIFNHGAHNINIGAPTLRP